MMPNFQVNALRNVLDRLDDYILQRTRTPRTRTDNAQDRNNERSNNFCKNLGDEHYKKIYTLLKKNLSSKEFNLFKVLVADVDVIHERGYRFTSSKNTVYTNIKIDASRYLELAPYQVTIHELWHTFDYLIGKKIDGNSLLYSCYFENELFPRTVLADVQAHIDSISNKNNLDLPSAIRYFYKQLNSLTCGGYYLTPHICVNAELYYLHDIIDGASNFIFKGEYKYIGLGSSLAQRDSHYWTMRRFASECFAALGCVHAAIPNIYIKLITFSRGFFEEYLPKSCKVYKEMIKTAYSICR